VVGQKKRMVVLICSFNRYWGKIHDGFYMTFPCNQCDPYIVLLKKENVLESVALCHGGYIFLNGLSFLWLTFSK
jgi:hypothetical protein